MARIGLRAVFYVGNAYSREVRQQLMALIDEYLGMSGGQIRAYQRAGDRRRLSAGPGRPVDLERLRERVENFKNRLGHRGVGGGGYQCRDAVVLRDGCRRRRFFPRALSAVRVQGRRVRDVSRVVPTVVQRARRRARIRGARVRPACGRHEHVRRAQETGPTRHTLHRFGSGLPWLRCDAVSRRHPHCQLVDGHRREALASCRWRADGAERRRVRRQVDGLQQGHRFRGGSGARDRRQGSWKNCPRLTSNWGVPLRRCAPTSPKSGSPLPEGYEAPDGFTSKSGWSDAEPEELPALHYLKTWMARFD